MNMGRLFVYSRRPLQISVLTLLVAVLLWPHPVVAQQGTIQKLSLAQVEELVAHHVPDSTMHTEIQRRGLAFSPTPAIVESLRAKGAGPQTLAAIEAHLPKAPQSAGVGGRTSATSVTTGGAKSRHGAPHQAVGRVEITTEPGSNLLMDGGEVGTASFDGTFVLKEVIEGQHELVARKANYQESGAKFVLAKNEVKQLTLPLEWAGGFLTVSVQPPVASVRISGPRNSNGSPADAKFPAGSYVLNVSADGFVDQTRYFRIAAGEHHAEQLQLEVDLVAAQAKAARGDGRSLQALVEALAHGAELSFPIKFMNYTPHSGQYTAFHCYQGPECGPPGSVAANLYDATVTVRKGNVSFSGSCVIMRGFRGREYCDFTVSPDKILGVANQPEASSRLYLQVLVKNKKGDKEEKKDYYFYNASAVATGAGEPNGPGTSFSCNGCDDSMSVLYRLLQGVRARN